VSCKTAKDVLALCREKDVKMVDLRFIDLPGLWQHFTIPVGQLKEDIFDEGLGFDGSSIRGWQAINESDMLVIPQAETAFLDPFTQMPTLVLICNIQDPITGEDYTRDPRNVARKVVNYLKSTGIADTAFIGPEAEFFVFDDVRCESNTYSSSYAVDSVEAWWNRNRDEKPNLGYKNRPKEGYFPVPPADQLQDIRSEMTQALLDIGITIEAQHHEVATAGQCEIDMRFAPLVEMADNMMKYKYIIKNVARKHNKTVTFMPKPLYGDNGSGMHTHFSFWKAGEPLFAGGGYAGLSDMALHAIGGVLKHAASIIAFSNPTTNSFKRLVPGYEAPVLLAYSSRNRSASCRIPYGAGPKAKRVEVRFPDPTANPYLAYAAMLMAGLDGIENRIHPGGPMDKNLPPAELKDIPTVAASLREALEHLDKSRAVFTRGGVFTDEQIDGYIELKMEEVMRCDLTPNPVEFDMYYSV
jgi:glutamine synthetase